MPLVVETTGEPVGELELEPVPDLPPGHLELEPAKPCCDACAGGKPCDGRTKAALVFFGVGGGMIAGSAALGAQIAGEDHRVMGAAGGAAIAGGLQQTALRFANVPAEDNSLKVVGVYQGIIGAGAAIGAAAAPKRRALGAFVGGAVGTAAVALVHALSSGASK